jgi:hypothetical protein
MTRFRNLAARLSEARAAAIPWGFHNKVFKQQDRQAMRPLLPFCYPIRRDGVAQTGMATGSTVRFRLENID